MSFLLSTEFVPASMIALHGQDAVGVVVAEGGEWADGVDEVSDIEAFELAGPSYTRIEGTFGVERIGDEWLLFVEGATAIDTSDSDDRVGVWLATDDGTLVGYQDDPGTGSGSYLPAWPDGVYALPITPSSASTGVQSVTGPGVNNADPSAPVIEHIPVPTGSTLGQVWTTNGPAVPASWQTPSGGGSGTSGPSIAATLDTGTEYVVDLSVLDDTAMSAVVTVGAGATKLTLTLPEPTSGRRIAVIVGSEDSTPFEVAIGVSPVITGAVAFAGIDLVVVGTGPWSWMPVSAWTPS